MRYVLCYDTPSARRRARVAKQLESCGFRVQFSVFEADLTAEMLRDLIVALHALIDRSEDNIRIYPVCQQCAGKVRVVGIPDPYGIARTPLMF